MHIKYLHTQQYWHISLKTLYHGGIRTRVFLLLRRMRCPLRRSDIFFSGKANVLIADPINCLSYFAYGMVYT
jgi:hypothetical protein